MLDPKGPALLCRPKISLQEAWSMPGGRVATYSGCTSWLRSLWRGRWMAVFQEERGSGMARSASDLKEQVPFAGHAVQLWSFLPALICLVCLWWAACECGREVLGRKQEQNGATPLGVTELRLVGQNPLSPLKRGRMGETCNAFVCNYAFFSCFQGSQSAIPCQQQNL